MNILILFFLPGLGLGEALMEYNEPTSEGGQRRYVLARNRGGQREHLVLLEAELFHRFNEDSLDSGELHS